VLRVVLVTQVPDAAHGVAELLRASGHDPVAVLCSREHAGRYGNAFDTLVRDAPAEMDVVIPASRARMAPLLRAYEPDTFLCFGFPWKIPSDALAVPRLGAVNGHPSLLPRYRGPSPVAWAIRNGDDEIGFTLHRMDAELDTGAVLAQTTFALGEAHSYEELGPRFAEIVGDLLPRALARLESGDPGDRQDESQSSYAGFFGPDYVWIDWRRSPAEIYRQVKAWRFASVAPGERGALAELDGETLRILRTSLDPVDGARAVACGEGTIWVMETEAP
jgi:methionyl-tRNA formyltransferase